MKAFMKTRRARFLAGGAVVVVATIVTAGLIVSASKPAPSAATGKAGAISNAAAADDWAALPLDAQHKPIGEPEIPQDKNGAALIPAGQAEEKRSADEPLPLVTLTSGVAVVDTTTGTAGLLAFLLDSENSGVSVRQDTCLLDWAKKKLPTVNGANFSGVIPVCGQDAAVMYGGYATSVRDLKLRTSYAVDSASRTSYSPTKAEQAALGEVLLKNKQLGYASVATEDGRGVLLIASAANKATTAPDTGVNNLIEPVVTEMPASMKQP